MSVSFDALVKIHAAVALLQRSVDRSFDATVFSVDRDWRMADAEELERCAWRMALDIDPRMADGV